MRGPAAGARVSAWAARRRRDGRAASAPVCARAALGLAVGLGLLVAPETPVTRAQPPRGLERPPVPVVLGRVTERAVAEEVSFIGSVEPDRAVTVQAEVAGRVVRADVREGERVLAGTTVLAELERTPKELQLAEARAQAEKARHEWEKLARGYRAEEIAAARQEAARAEARLRDLEAGARPQEREEARSTVKAAEARRGWAEREFERMRELFDQGLVAAQERDRTWQAYEVARSDERAARERLGLLEAGTRPAQIEGARAELAQARDRQRLLEAGPRSEEIAQAAAEYQRAAAVVARIEDELRRMTIVASVTGFLVRKRAELGAWVRPADPVADLIDLDPVYVVGPVSEREVGSLRSGARARVVVDAYPERVFHGEVAHVVPQADPQSRTFPVKVRLANPDHALKAGMFARVAVDAGGSRKALFVPKDAVVRRDGTVTVFIVEQGVARTRPVKTGRPAGELVEIMDGALTAGQAVVVVGNESLQDGARIQPVAPGRPGTPAQPGAPRDAPPARTR